MTMAALLLTAPVGVFAQSAGVGSQFELVFWQSVAASEDPAQYQAYLAQYPNGTFSALARAKLAALQRSAGPAAAASVPVPQAQPVVAPPTVTPAPVAPPAPQVSPVVVPAPAPVSPAPVPTPINPAAPHPPATVAAPPATPPPLPARVATPEPAPAPAPAPAVTPVAAPVSPAAPADPVQALAEQLRQLSAAQGQPAPAPSGAASSGVALPPRPQLAAVPEVRLPRQFCSAMARNAFYDASFVPTKALADENNRTAIAHMQALQAQYDALARRGDPDGQNVLSAEAHAYQPVAEEAYRVSKTFEPLFVAIMAVPIVPCPGNPAP